MGWTQTTHPLTPGQVRELDEQVRAAQEVAFSSRIYERSHEIVRGYIKDMADKGLYAHYPGIAALFDIDVYNRPDKRKLKYLDELLHEMLKSKEVDSGWDDGSDFYKTEMHAGGDDAFEIRANLLFSRAFRPYVHPAAQNRKYPDDDSASWG